MTEPLDYSQIFRFHVYRAMRKNRPEPDRYFVIGNGEDQDRPPAYIPPPPKLRVSSAPAVIQRECSLAWPEQPKEPATESRPDYDHIPPVREY